MSEAIFVEGLTKNQEYFSHQMLSKKTNTGWCSGEKN